jgi:cell division protein ZapA (FtsZ GTPase activity inhibitor)
VAKVCIKAGTTSKLLDIFIQDSSSTTGAGLTGLVFNSASLTAYYYREGAASATAITLATMTLGTWATGGFVVVDGTNMPGCYQLGIPDAAIASGAKSVLVMLKGATNTAPLVLEVELTAVDNQSATAFITGVNSLAPPTNWNLHSIDANGRVDVIKVAGTTQTAGDIIGDTNDIQTTLATTAAYIDTEVAAIKAKTDNLPTDPADQSLIIAATDAIAALIGTPAGVSVSADVAAVKAETATILADTNDIQTRIPAALVAGRIDASVGAMAANVQTAASTAADYVTELQSGLSTLDAAGIRTAVGLATANLDTQIGTLATAANLATVAGYLDTEIATIITAVGVIDDFLDTEIAAIKAKTDNLPADPADASDIAASFTTVNTKLDTIDDFLDTEVAAIKAKTDNLPATPAATGDAMALTTGERDSVADALLARNVSGGSSTGRTVKQAMHLLRNKHDIVAGVLTVCDTDDATTSWTAAVTTTAGNPISAVDPT